MRKHLLYLLLLWPVMALSQVDLVSEDQLRYLDQELQDKLAALEEAKEEGKEFQAFTKLGDLYRKQRNYEKAISYYRQSLGYIDFSNGVDDLVEAQYRLGRVLFANANYEEALEIFEEVEALSEVSDRPGRIQIDNLEFKGRTQVQLGLIGDAEPTYEDMHSIALELFQDTTTAIEALAFVAELQNVAGDYLGVVETSNLAESLESVCQGGPNVNLMIEKAHALAKVGRTKESILTLQKAEDLATGEIVFVQKEAAKIYLENGNKKDALLYADKAIESATLRNNQELLIDLHTERAELLASMKRFKDGIASVKISSEVKESLQTKQLLDNSKRLRIGDYMTNAENQFAQRLLQSELEAADAKQEQLRIRSEQLEKERIKLEKEKKDQELALLKEQAERNKAEQQANALEIEQAKSALELISQRNLALQRKQTNEQLIVERREDSLRAAVKQQNQLRENQLLEQGKLIAENNAKQQETASKRNKWIAGFMAIGLLTAVGFYINTRRLSRKVETERQRAEQLLLNVLPKSIAEELKENGSAAPLKYDSATVLFTDFVGFTSISSNLAPEEIIEELNQCFTAFDAIAQRHNIEKIKTIGDSYMCAGGIPDANNTHAFDAVKAGQEMVAFMNKRNAQHRRDGKTLWPIRVGVHTGELVAGVVGSSKFAYDIWGDTVNVASRMERGAEHDSINVSEATYLLIKDRFDCQFRGDIDVKNKGKMGMYRVD